MKKIKSNAFGKDCYLLGKDADGVYYWLEQSKFDCGWYWGIGYVETYTNNKYPNRSRDINSHTHFDGMFFNKKKCSYDVFKEFFVETTLTDKETWVFLELMKSLYTLRQYSDLLHIGGAHFTTNPCKNAIQNETEYNRINNEVIPALLNEVYTILTPSECD